MTLPVPGPDRRDAGRIRARIDLAYDGTGYSGWAHQPGLPTVQQDLAGALALVCGEPIEVVCAGRTDAGVHARGQVVHADLPGDVFLRRTWHGLVAQLNRHTDDRIRIHSAAPAPDGFDARFAALSRHYCYRLCDDAARFDPLTRTWVVLHPRPLDPAAMHAAGAALVGEHDFAAFCRAKERATTIRRVLYLEVGRDQADRVEVSIGADAFCHSMVRSVVGALVAVGEGRRPVGWVAEVLAGGMRDSGARVMPAAGLTLERVDYPPDDGLSQRVARTRRLRQKEPAVEDTAEHGGD